MMKRNILAVVIPALLAAGAANAAEVYNKDGNKLDLYGKVDGLHYFSDDKGSDGDQSYARFGFKGETQISDQLAGYGQWEYNIKVNNTESNGSSKNATRLGFAGLKFGDAGSIDYGRNYGVIYDVEAWTDMLPEFGGDSYTNTDNFMTGRTNGVATYRNNNFFGLVDGLNIAAQYQGKTAARPKATTAVATSSRTVTATVCLPLTISVWASALVQRTLHLTVLISKPLWAVRLAATSLVVTKLMHGPLV